ncbi:integrase [Methylorubrum extorquens]
MPEVVAVLSSTRVPWNRGRIVGPKPPLKPKHIWALRTRLQLANRTRDLALFNLAVDSKLRGCDLVGLRVSDIHLGDAVRLRATVCQRKTGRPVPFEITEPTREALAAWLTARRLKARLWNPTSDAPSECGWFPPASASNGQRARFVRGNKHLVRAASRSPFT